MSEPRDSVDLLKEYSTVRIFSPDTFRRARTLMANTANEVGELRAALAAMCGWAELLAEKADWTRDNSASFWASRDAARMLAPDPFPRADIASSGHREDCYRQDTDGKGRCTCDYLERFPPSAGQKP